MTHEETHLLGPVLHQQKQCQEYDPGQETALRTFLLHQMIVQYRNLVGAQDIGLFNGFTVLLWESCIQYKISSEISINNNIG